MIYVEAKRLVDLAVQYNVLSTQDSGILIYRNTGSDPEKYPEGWYLENKEDVYRDVMADAEGQKALISALKVKGIDFAEEQRKIHLMMDVLKTFTEE